MIKVKTTKESMLFSSGEKPDKNKKIRNKRKRIGTIKALEYVNMKTNITSKSAKAYFNVVPYIPQFGANPNPKPKPIFPEDIDVSKSK